ncbi:D-2-hydroxyacid dehydrogenase [Defluviimonas sp. 20V17]|uniref:D-2-hydroxyacid dehydrogenase n=1 Tax=Allgaiera indica TaxID=765699 RepID=A0AAN4UR16_9RHOB|nr:FAD-binding oxidoreductase [Allgaiera indica]KDB03119.1 D-2-hydroxyacid dehydrogenase [Defluviimonas sp. 20V17]GHE00858.1 D-2-hydroxyacid dehydrogenase [Allgaiera indica]SDW73306.1 FAD/FMN-containing dehydrogenase [Allgaiera indica]
MTLRPADDAFAAMLEARIPGVVRPLGPQYLEEPRGRYVGSGGVVAAPRSTQEVAQLVRACAEARVAIVPRGGGTGLVGGQVMPGGAPLILSLERMRAIRALDVAENVLIAEAGVVLEEVQSAAAAADRLFPLSLASQGSCQVGGILATNAGGVNVLRYGTARALCLGVEAVLADGSVLHGLKRLRKDNTGYDLRDLIVGAEGTLGIITAASLKLSPIPAETGAALISVPDPSAALSLLALARDRLGEGVSAFELIAGQGFAFLRETMPDLRQPFAAPPAWTVLIELGLPRGLSPDQALTDLFAEAAEAGLADDGVIAQSAAQRAEFWTLREAIPQANRRIGAIASHDISLPLSAVADFIAEAPGLLARIADVRINCFGHLGDGNLHYNIFPMPGRARGDYDAQRPEITRAVHDLVVRFDGSISAEHGIGRLKVEELERYGDPVALAVMRSLKQTLDPLGILNPGAVLHS